MKRTLKMSVCTAVIGSLLLTACATSGKNDATVQGGVGGAAIGGLIGALVGGRQGALIGAAIGGGVGLVAGSVIDERRNAYASDEDFYDGQIAQTRNLNAELGKRNGSLREEIALDQKETKRLAKEAKAGKARKDQLLAQKSSLDERRQKNTQLMADLDKELLVQKEVLAKAETAPGGAANPRAQAMKVQVAALEKEIGELQKMVNEMGTQSATLGQYL